MIKCFRIENFKSLRDLQLDAEPVNVLIGPNGCGKSSVLQAIDFLRAFFMSSVELYLQEKDWNYRDLPNLRQSSKTIRWRVTAELPADLEGRLAGTYDYLVTLSPRRHLAIGHESLSYSALGEPVSPGERTLLLERKGRLVRVMNRSTHDLERRYALRTPASVISTLDPFSEKRKYPELLHFRRWVEGFRYFLIWDPKILRRPDRGRYQLIGPSGEHLAPVLGLLRKTNPGAFDKLLARIRDLFPHVSDITVSGEQRGWGWRSLWLSESNGTTVRFNSQQMADGVLRLLAVACLLYLEPVPTVIMLEEPENGLHPRLLRQVVQILRELTRRKPPNACQVLFTSHSPYVLDEFYDHPEQVFVMQRPTPQAGARITKLSRASEIGSLRSSFQGSLGEAWYTLGEEVLGRGG